MTGKSTLVTVIAVISAIVAPVAAILVAYGLLTQEQAELWVALLVALVGAIGAAAPVFIARSFNESQAVIAAAIIESGNQSLINRL